jgi:hypothetical protein
MVDLDFWIFWKIEDEGLNNEGYKGLPRNKTNLRFAQQYESNGESKFVKANGSRS